jgi:hypothetical protein
MKKNLGTTWLRTVPLLALLMSYGAGRGDTFETRFDAIVTYTVMFSLFYIFLAGPVFVYRWLRGPPDEWEVEVAEKTHGDRSDRKRE